MKLQIAICDKNKGSARILQTWLLEFAKEKRFELDVTLYNHETIFRWYLEHAVWYDLVLIDICLPDGQGIELARKIRQHWGRRCVNIIFTSFYRGCCRELFELEPLNVYLKPLEKEKLFWDMEKIINRGGVNKCVLRYTENKLVKAVHFQEILYIKAEDKKLIIKLAHGEIRIRGSLNRLERQFRCAGFCRCHRSFLVNMEWVKSYRNRMLGLCDGSMIPVGASYGVTLRDALRWFSCWRW